MDDESKVDIPASATGDIRLIIAIKRQNNAQLLACIEKLKDRSQVLTARSRTLRELCTFLALRLTKLCDDPSHVEPSVYDLRVALRREA